MPLKATSCVLPTTLPLSSVMTSVALWGPVAAGVNVTLIVQVAFAASVLPQVLADTEKSGPLAPDIATLEMFKVVFPVLARATVRGRGLRNGLDPCGQGVSGET